MGSHILTFSIAMNVITGHATCTIVWGVVGSVILWILTLPRTLKKVSYLSIICKFPNDLRFTNDLRTNVQP